VDCLNCSNWLGKVRPYEHVDVCQFNLLIHL
jgi:hypothetical protein